MKVNCKHCGVEFNKAPSEINKTKNNFCCRSHAAKYNNEKYPKRPGLTKTGAVGRVCKHCGTMLKFKHHNYSKTYCSVKCQQDKRYRGYITRWVAGEETGNRGRNQNLLVSKNVRRWLYEVRGEKCEECGWDKRNPISNSIPIETHHIDGNAENTTPENMKLLCPNCHALTPTYRALNAGNGRKRVYT